MPSEKRADPRKGFVQRRLPWVLAIVAFFVYCLTLEHWVSIFNSAIVANLSGWEWRPQVVQPLDFLVTFPFRWLPAAAIPAALNLFSAVCAALTLALLARSVALLPQDRTEPQRRREKSDFSFLTTTSAWLPPLLAVAVCGLQFTFWEHATNYSGEMFDLLLFAFVIWSLLEYRLDEHEPRLFLAAFVYGAAMAENWAMVGFFPVYLAAIIWIRGLAFFDLLFIVRMMLCGTAGLLFFLLLPLAAVTFGGIHVTLWEVLKINLMGDHAVVKSIIRCIFDPGQYYQYIALVFAYLMPVLVMAIRWKASFGDTSRFGQVITSAILHIAHAIFLGVFIWMAFDPPFSPRTLGSPEPLLTFYYLGALAIGYYSGYLLLVCGKEEVSRKGRPPLNQPLKFLNKPTFFGVYLLALAALAGLVHQNVPLIRGANDNTLRQYAKLVEEKLPHTGGLLLSDDPVRLFLVRSALVQDGRANEYVPLETTLLPLPDYHHFLHREFPQKWHDFVPPTLTNSISPVGLVQLLGVLSRTNDLYYLNPSFGYYFERFYLEPHGLVYRMKTLPADTLRPPPPDAGLISENQDFWTRDAVPAMTQVTSTISPPPPNAALSWGDYILSRLHISSQPDQDAAVRAGVYYSRSLNFWAVQLQRAGKLESAATNFQTALLLNPDNSVARINLDFNRQLLSREPVTIDPSRANPDRLGKYPTFVQAMTDGGPFDDPDFCFVYGTALALQNGLYRQSLAQLERVRELAPDFLPARLTLAGDYLINRRPELALDVLRGPIEDPEKYAVDQTNEIEIQSLTAAAYFQETNNARAIELLNTEVASHPDDNGVLVTAARIFIVRGLYQNALGVIDRRLKTDPDNPAWLYNKGYVSLELKNYPAAIAALDRVLAIQTNNGDALFNRALANLDSGRLDAARADYLRLQLAVSNAPAITYGLGEIAWQKNETNDAVRYYQLYLARANTNTDEAKAVAARLKALKP
ncbi:MAG: tetratricopeptide repeat protein [Limisphaerales bacterium]